MINSRAAANYNLKGITEATSVITHFDNVNFLQCKGFPTDLSHLVTPACVTKQQLGLGITRQLNARRDFSLSSNRIESERKERTEADGEYLSDDGGEVSGDIAVSEGVLRRALVEPDGKK